MKNDFITKNMASITEAIDYSIFANRYAGVKGLLQRLDPRIKLITFLILLVITGLTKTIAILIILYVLTLVLAAFSRISLFFFVKRVWVFIPIFTGFIVLPAIFNFITPGKPLLTVATFSTCHRFGPFYIPKIITVTNQGVTGALMIVMRVATSVSIAVLMLLTTKWISILKAFSVLRIPAVIILTLTMTYRYIHLLLKTVEGMLLARKSRQLSSSNLKEAHGWVVSRLGVLVGKSYNLSNDVHLAMLSRGWSENPRLIDNFSISLIDWLWSGFIAMVLILWIILR